MFAPSEDITTRLNFVMPVRKILDVFNAVRTEISCTMSMFGKTPRLIHSDNVK